jgi:hypothetical protein
LSFGFLQFILGKTKFNLFSMASNIEVPKGALVVLNIAIFIFSYFVILSFAGICTGIFMMITGMTMDPFYYDLMTFGILVLWFLFSMIFRKSLFLKKK